ncbi:MAG: hypothetical protein BWY54_00417 [Candidatus Dependentiae bacterium ADurb.Bin331]|nr:MAG: hypothetical protein BWY54_00417 [Candidatus Dependentiae bacterium ADurb.Bin331]
MYSINKTFLIFFLAFLTAPAAAELPSLSQWKKMAKKEAQKINPHLPEREQTVLKLSEVSPFITENSKKLTALPTGALTHKFLVYTHTNYRVTKPMIPAKPLLIEWRSEKNENHQDLNQNINLQNLNQTQKKTKTLSWANSVRKHDGPSLMDYDLLRLTDYTKERADAIENKANEIIQASKIHQQKKANESLLNWLIRITPRKLGASFQLTDTPEFTNQLYQKNCLLDKTIARINSKIENASPEICVKLEYNNDHLLIKQALPSGKKIIKKLENDLQNLPDDAKTAREEITLLLNLAKNQYKSVKDINEKINLKLYKAKKQKVVPLSTITGEMQSIFNGTNILLSNLADVDENTQYLASQFNQLKAKKTFTLGALFNVHRISNQDQQKIPNYRRDLKTLENTYKIICEQTKDTNGNENRQHPKRVLAREMKNFAATEFDAYRTFMNKKIIMGQNNENN